MSGLVGVIANDSARYSVFWSCMDHLMLPEGWKKEHLIGGDWCGARNTLVQMALEGDYDYLWFMDDDHAFAPDILLKLLAHDKPLVVPVCLTRSAPFVPVTFTEKVGEDRYLPVYLPGQGASGLVELVAGGCAGMLIRRDVLQSIDGPHWFEYGWASEDIIFCEKAKSAGFEIYCDLAARLGHITTAIVWPAVYDEQWCVGVNVGSSGQTTQVLLPIETGDNTGSAPIVDIKERMPESVSV